MNWSGIFWVFALSTIKFMFSPISGPAFKLSFLETYFAVVSGGIVGAVIFYFPADYFMRRAEEKRRRAIVKALKEGRSIKVKKKFTKFNRVIIWIKHKIGQVGIAFWAPFLLSVPVGSIVTAKFYGNSRKTFPLIIIGMFINAFLTTALVYLFYTP